MAVRLACVLTLYSLLYLFTTDCSIVKPNNIPRIGRSDESGGPFEQDTLGYVIKTNKNIPRMGRRNYDSGDRYDIPKLYQVPRESYLQYNDEKPVEYSQEDLFIFGDRQK
ncbi:hypothetical protein ACJJTC_005747 [Scirpophaga incertulas]